jgi:hypothetical protein
MMKDKTPSQMFITKEQGQKDHGKDNGQKTKGGGQRAKTRTEGRGQRAKDADKGEGQRQRQGPPLSGSTNSEEIKRSIY